MKSRVTRLLFYLFLFGCTPYLPIEVKHYPLGTNTAVLDQTTVLSRTDSLVFEMQFSFLDGAGFYDIGEIQTQDFTFVSPGTYKILDFTQHVASGDPGVEVVILEDVSGNYDTLDPHNFRSKMINKLCQDIQSPGGFVIGGFSKEGSLQPPVEFSAADFSTDWKSQQDFIFSLPQREGGYSSLYDALSKALDRIVPGTSTNKHVVVLAHATDHGSTTSLSDVISKANAGNVKIDMLYLGNEADVGVIQQLSSLTGGMLAILNTDLELITIYSQFFRLLTGERHIYTMKVSYRPESGVFSSPEVTHKLTVVDYTSGKNYNPVVIYTKIP